MSADVEAFREEWAEKIESLSEEQLDNLEQAVIESVIRAVQRITLADVQGTPTGATEDDALFLLAVLQHPQTAADLRERLS